ncbi:hypothetical protein GJAV_G00050200 [Gymnothorax javanicus]|nr:hypothetical protein GJAV_G00050200 [Gymnothorax javanicus]
MLLSERAYKPISSVDQLAVHFVLEGTLLHRDSDEARRQAVRHGLAEEKGPAEATIEEVDEEAPETPVGGEEPAEGEAEPEEGGAEERAESAEIKGGGQEQKLTNQFNFSERASQTLNNPLRLVTY